MNALEKAISFAGGKSKLAQMLGVSHSSVSRWYHGHDRVPLKHAFKIEELTGEQIKAREFLK